MCYNIILCSRGLEATPERVSFGSVFEFSMLVLRNQLFEMLLSPSLCVENNDEELDFIKSLDSQTRVDYLQVHSCCFTRKLAPPLIHFLTSFLISLSHCNRKIYICSYLCSLTLRLQCHWQGRADIIDRCTADLIHRWRAAQLSNGGGGCYNSLHDYRRGGRSNSSKRNTCQRASIRQNYSNAAILSASKYCGIDLSRWCHQN